MARGKQTCKILKEIRRQIAEANDIEFVTSECRYKGDCLGTCPKCEAEVRYLEQQLRARSLAGKVVTLAGISAGMILMSGCSGTSSNQSNEILQGEPWEMTDSTEYSDYIEGDVEEGGMCNSYSSTENNQPTDSCGVKEGEMNSTKDFPILVFGEVSDKEFPTAADAEEETALPADTLAVNKEEEAAP